ncbi:MAG TPA: isochorismatase family protein [Roseateles sp.]|nr:isochorismatase family protein [Roseateles sp.]
MPKVLATTDAARPALTCLTASCLNSSVYFPRLLSSFTSRLLFRDSPGLAYELRSSGATSHLIVTGIAADNCVFFTAMDAYLRGYSLWVPIDCVAAESAEARDQALQQMARVLKADIRPSVSTTTSR